MESKLQLSEAAGHYEPSFFRMHINTKEKIEKIENLKAYDFSTLMHEYIHFIQDVTTLYGLGNIYNSVQYIKYATNQVYRCGYKFEVPIKLNENTFNGSLINFSSALQKITYGDVKSYDAKLFKIEKSRKKLGEHLDMDTISIYNLKINIKKYGCYTYQFGAGCIMETMAYILEKCISGVDSDLPEYPYNVAAQVCEAYYKNFSRNKFRLLALCDISLNSSNPAHTFINLLEIWKKKEFIPSNARELYDDFKNNSKFILSQENASGVTKYNVDIESQFQQYVDSARESLHGYFIPKNTDNTDEFTQIMNLLNQWIDEIMNSTLKWRRKKPYFIIDIAEGGIKDRKAIVETYNEFGLPFCTNANYEGCFYHRNIKSSNLRLYSFIAVRQISGIFRGKLGKCNMYDYCMKCKNDNKGNVDPDIKCYAPWLRDDYKDMCPFVMVWNHWNLKGRRPYEG